MLIPNSSLNYHHVETPIDFSIVLPIRVMQFHNSIRPSHLNELTDLLVWLDNLETKVIASITKTVEYDSYTGAISGVRVKFINDIDSNILMFLDETEAMKFKLTYKCYFVCDTNVRVTPINEWARPLF